MDFVVQKYGGTSVGSLERIKRVADHVAVTRSNGVNVVVVVSAMGEQTDELIAMARSLSEDPPRREVDMLLTAGERITMALLSIALHERGLKSVSLTGSQSGILTDETHGNARIEKILGDRIRQGLDDGAIVIVAGFQGVSPRTREVTTLGRGGSDLSAVALASVLGASRCELYKDVEGVFTADPRIVSDARKIDSLPWYAMSELAWAGANVLHARAAHVASRFGLIAEIRSSFQPQSRGTIIEPATGVDVDMSTSKHGLEQATLHAIASKPGMCLLEIESASDDAIKMNSAVLEFLWNNGEAPAINQQTGSLTRLFIPEALAVAIKEGAGSGRFGVKTHSAKISMQGLAAVTVAGNGFLQNPEIVAKLLASASAAGKVLLWDVRNHALMVGVGEKDTAAVVKAMHGLF
jgi:aspartate kinase